MSDQELSREQMDALKAAGFDSFDDLEASLSPEVRQAIETLCKEFTLQTIRERLGLTQADVAARMQVSQSALSKVERRQEDMQIRTLRRYARALGGRLDLVLTFPGQAPIVYEVDESRQTAHRT